MKAKITILGCGNSTGVPAIGNYWGKCDPHEPKNRRMRPSVLIESDNTKIVIDTGPDFRHQINNANIDHIDAVLYTHEHGDHAHGIDDLRVIAFRNKGAVPVYGNRETLEQLEIRFRYLFKGGEEKIYPPVLEPHYIDNFGQEILVGDVPIVPFEQDHGHCNTVGYRIGNFAYSTDLKTLPQNAFEPLKGVDTWVVDCAGYQDANNPVHAHIDHIYELNKRVRAKSVYLTSLSLAMDYDLLSKELRAGYAPCYDGLELEVTL